MGGCLIIIGLIILALTVSPWFAVGLIVLGLMSAAV